MSSRDEQSETLSTSPMSEEELARLRSVRLGTSLERYSLIIFSRDGIRAVPLSEGAHVVIGRSEPADVTIRDESLSRQHLTVALENGKVWLEDLDSTNGTWVEGARIDRAQVGPGVALAIGSVTASIVTTGPSTSSHHGLESHDRFIDEMNAEVSRARAFGRSVSLLLIRSKGQGRCPLSQWFAKLDQILRPFDRAALYSGDTVEVMLPETPVDRALEFASSILGIEPSLCCGLGVVPLHAASSGELVEVTLRALQKARKEEPLQPARPHDTSELGSTSTEVSRPIFNSAAMETVFKNVARVAPSPLPVLVMGETGTGKEIVTRAIHEWSGRSEHPLICINCGAMPSQLVESTLFGHEKGTFTGADQRMKGVFEVAHCGTVMLDEVGELPLPAQAALLRVLETHQFRRLGSTEELEVDVRVIAATHRDLKKLCAAKQFRSDLFFRLNTVSIVVPPLRDRPEEIELLARHFVAELDERNGGSATHIDVDALDLLQSYPWPGNVRELRNAIERGVIIAEGDSITVRDLPRSIREWSIPTVVDDVQPTGPRGDINLRAEVERFEAELVMRTLDHKAWNRKETARALGLPIRTLRYKMNLYGIKR